MNPRNLKPIAVNSYQDKIAAFDHALKLAPNYIYALFNKGETLKKLGDHYKDLSQSTEALNSWQSALELVDRCLELAPNDEDAQNLRDEILEKIQNSD